jgi:hypothetical protein
MRRGIRRVLSGNISGKEITREGGRIENVRC